jgi:hypothetical protein
VNYAALVQAIQNYCENTEDSFVANIPLFVQQAEQRIYNQIQFPSLRKNVIGNTTENNKYLACPTDFLAVYSLAVVEAPPVGEGLNIEDGVYTYLLNKDVNFIRESYPTPNATGLPQYYALFGPRSTDPNELTFILGPTPDGVYQVELHYFYYPESITTAALGTSWLGDNFDSVLLYGALIEAYTYMKGEQDMLTLYDTKYKEAIALAKRLGDGLERRDAYRSGQTRIQVP